jgi:hypothetical protein
MKKKIKSWIRNWLIGGPPEGRKIQLSEEHKEFFRRLAEARESLHIIKSPFGAHYMLWFRHKDEEYVIKLPYKSRAWTILSYCLGDKTFFPSRGKDPNVQSIPWERMETNICNLVG